MNKHPFRLPDGGDLESLVWFWRLPLVAVGLIILLFALFIWFGLSQEFEERQAALVSDTLWMEQNLRFQFDSTEESLAQIGSEFAVSGDLHSDAAQDRVRSLLRGSSGLIAILLLDMDGATVSALPAGGVPVQFGTEHDATLKRARALNRSAYTAPYATPEQGHVFEMIVPVFGASDFHGYVVGIYSLSRIIEKQVPWWFAERYRLVLTDAAQTEIARTAQAGLLDKALSFKVTLDRAGGVGIQVDAYRATTRVMPLLVVIVLVVSGLVIIWSFWTLRRHIVRLHATEEALRREYTFRLAMENSTLIGLCARGVDGSITYVNAAFCRMVGWSEQELLGNQTPILYPLHETAPSAVAAGSQTAPAHSQDPNRVIETQLKGKNGEIIDVLISEAPLNDANGKQTGWMSSVLDITERKNAESLARAQQERLEATARLVTMGEMASTLAHEINQPLSAIASYSAGCLNAIRNGRFDEQQFNTVLGKINHQAQRAGRIVHRIYGYVRRNESRTEIMSINAAVQEAVELIEAEAQRRKVLIRPEPSRQALLVSAERMMIEQILVNLLRNAIDAVANSPKEERLVRICTEPSADGGVLVSVIDRGCGIPPEVADKLFDSFFTTKPKGMGVGLKICRTIAEQHHGRLWFEADAERGTAFFLYLPAPPAADPQSTQQPTHHGFGAPGNARTHLVGAPYHEPSAP